MKKLVLVVIASVALMSATVSDQVMSKEKGMTVVNTTTIASDVEGYNGPVPVKIYIKKNKVQYIEVLKNTETPKYMAKVKKSLLNAWDGLTVKEARKKEVDAVTGATFTSEALKENVNRGLDYYKSHK